MVEKLFLELSQLEQVDAIALGGSRSTEIFDEKSDYDVYLYCNSAVSEDMRKEILQKYCDIMEIGNHFWEYEDNCTLKNGIDIDILYRDLNSFTNDLADVVENFQPRNGYTTCMWHNLLTCKIIYDKNGDLQKAKERFTVAYPKQLKDNIINRNMLLLSEAMPAYKLQILKAVNRGDIVSISHRTSAFMESYFDIIFAVNELTHPGEKRLISLCKKHCKILPEKFEENIAALFSDLYANSENVSKDIDRIIDALKKII